LHVFAGVAIGFFAVKQGGFKLLCSKDGQQRWAAKMGSKGGQQRWVTVNVMSSVQKKSFTRKTIAGIWGGSLCTGTAASNIKEVVCLIKTLSP
jgi:hypothetical protein